MFPLISESGNQSFANTPQHPYSTSGTAFVEDNTRLQTLCLHWPGGHRKVTMLKVAALLSLSRLTGQVSAPTKMLSCSAWTASSHLRGLCVGSPAFSSRESASEPQSPEGHEQVRSRALWLANTKIRSQRNINTVHGLCRPQQCGGRSQQSSRKHA